jgi:transcriptional regulator with GAF, ATPase, and Fis domain/tetratricopeptide (TPR) repeat protein
MFIVLLDLSLYRKEVVIFLMLEPFSGRLSPTHTISEVSMKKDSQDQENICRDIQEQLAQCSELKTDKPEHCRECLGKLAEAHLRALSLPASELRLDLLYRLLRCHFLLGNNREARLYIDEYLNMLKQCAGHPMLGKVYHISGRLHWQNSEYHPAIADFQSSLDISINNKDWIDVAGLNQNIGTLYHNLGETELSTRHLQEAIGGFRRACSPDNENFAKSNLANLHISQGRFTEALALKLETIEYYRSAGHLKQLAMDLGAVGNIYFRYGQYEKAIELTLESLKIKESLNDETGIATVWLNLGAYYRDFGDLETALEYHRKALGFFETNNGKSQIIMLHNNIGNVRQEQGEHQSALKHFLRAWEISKELGEQELLAIASQNIGIIKSTYLGELQSAMDFFNQAMQSAQKLDNPLMQGELLLNTSGAQIRANLLPQAKNSLDKAEKLIRSHGLDTLLDQLHYFSTQYYISRKDPEAANRSLLLYTDQLRARQKQDAISRIAEMQALYETEKMTRETEILRQKTAELEDKNKEIELQHKELQETLDRLQQSEIKYNFVSEELTRGIRTVLIGKSEAIRNITEMITMVARSDNTHVLITGETGTGKEIVARNIHSLSKRGKQHFYAVNCSAVPDTLFESQFFGHEKDAFTGAVSTRIGWFEIADKSTLFLDEIGSMSPEQQAKLLRVLEERNIVRVGSHKEIPVDIRIISATNTNLIEDVNNEKFRRDLYHRLAIFVINIPPLRERREDIPLLFEHFVGTSCAALNKKISKIEKDILSSLMEYDFPGNVRELRNMVERAVLVADSSTLRLPHFIIPMESSRHGDRIVTLEEAEKDLILRALRSTGFNRTQAARLLGVERKVVERKITKYKLSEQEH